MARRPLKSHVPAHKTVARTIHKRTRSRGKFNAALLGHAAAWRQCREYFAANVAVRGEGLYVAASAYARERQDHFRFAQITSSRSRRAPFFRAHRSAENDRRPAAVDRPI